MQNDRLNHKEQELFHTSNSENRKQKYCLTLNFVVLPHIKQVKLSTQRNCLPAVGKHPNSCRMRYPAESIYR